MRKIICMMVLVGAVHATAAKRVKREPDKINEVIIQQEDRTEYEKNTIIDFNDLQIEGDINRPEGSYVKIRRKTNFKSLIELRSNFRPEMMKAAADL